MSRLLMFGNIKRAAHSVLKTRGSSNLGLIRDGTYPLFQPFVPQYRVHSQFRHNHGGYMPNNLYKHPQFTYKSVSPRNYSSMYASNTIAHHAQTAWKRISKMCSSHSSTIPSISRAAGLFSIASTKCHMLVPGIFTLIFGELALVSAESEYLPSSNAVYTRAQDGHAYMRRLILNLLEVLILLLRAVYLALLFSPSIAMAPFADSFGPHFRSVWLQVVHRTLEKAGPAFIKWGQWAASRPDLFPIDLCSELSKLHSNAPEHSYAYTKRTVEQAFGRKLSEIFESFDEKPVASGSIAQIHRAVLRFRHPGQKTKPTEVAVKVRHPGVGDSIRRDFVIINTVAKVSTLVPTLKWLRLDESVQQFAVFMMSQVDLSREAANLNRFIYNFRRWRDVSFPKPLYPLVHPAVLVETFEHGESVAHYVDDGFDGHERFKTALAHLGTHALLKMLLVDNFIHADMHPGNILVRLKHGKRKGGAKSKPHVVFIDVGMTAELAKNDRVILLDFFKAVARRDGRTVAERTLQLSKKQSCPNPDAFIQEVKTSFDFWATPEGDLVHPADAMQQLLEQVRRHKVNIDGDVCTVIVTTLVLEVRKIKVHINDGSIENITVVTETEWWSFNITTVALHRVILLTSNFLFLPYQGWQRKLDPDYNVMRTLQTLLFKADWAKSLSYTIEGLMAP